MNYNRGGTFGTRPQSAKPIVKPKKKNNFEGKSEKPQLIQPEWNSTQQENPHKLSEKELIQRKLAAKSKHELSAKLELQQKLDKLAQGKVPKEYKEIISKEKKFTSKQAFISNEGLRKEYENRSFASQQQRRQEQFEKEGILQEDYDEEFEQLAVGMNQQTFNQRETQAFKVVQPIVTAKAQPKPVEIQRFAQPKPVEIQRFQEPQRIQEYQRFQEPQRIQEYQPPPKPQFQKPQEFQPPEQQQQPFFQPLREPRQPDPDTYQSSLDKYESFMQNLKQNMGIQPQPESKNQEYDYLDYEENEKRLNELKSGCDLDRLRGLLDDNQVQTSWQETHQEKQITKNNQPVKINVNMNSNRMVIGMSQQQKYEPYFKQEPQQPKFQNQYLQPQPEMDDLDSAFKNLNLLLGKNESQAPEPRGEPQGLLPNYKDLLFGGGPPQMKIDFQDLPKPQPFIPPAQSMPQRFSEQTLSQVQHQNQLDYQNRPYGKQLQVTGPPRSVIQAPVAAPEEDEEDFSKLRQMLLDTQNEIDKIIS